MKRRGNTPRLRLVDASCPGAGARAHPVAALPRDRCGYRHQKQTPSSKQDGVCFWSHIRDAILTLVKEGNYFFPAL
jgi:hypothetical protein